MKKITSIVVALVCGLCVYAQDYTNRIVNAHLDSVAKGVHFSATTDPNYPKHPNGTPGNGGSGTIFRPILASYTTVNNHLEYYGWQLSDWGFLFKKYDGTDIVAGGMTDYQATGIYQVSGTNGMVSIGGNKYCKMPEDFEFYQIINGLPAGEYKVTCGLGVQNNYLTSQRLFANNSVQFYGASTNYAQNKTAGETYSYAGYSTSSDANTLNAMTVSVTIAENEPLKIGIRSGNTKGDGTTRTGGEAGFGNMYGFFKVDNFTITKIVPPTYANLESLSVTGATLSPAFNPATTSYTCTLPQGTTIFPGTSIIAASAATVSKQMGSVDVTGGSDTYKIAVTSSDQSVTNVYTITFTAPMAAPIANATDYTSSVINNDFDYAAAGIAWNATTDSNYPKHPDGTSAYISNVFRPIKANYTTASNHLEFYGWNFSDWGWLFKDGSGTDIATGGTTTSQDMGIIAGYDSSHGASAWINGNKNCIMPDDFEFYQTVNNLPAGTYRLSCLMAVQAAQNLTSQRLFANNNVQFFADESNYAAYSTSNEVKTYAGYATTTPVTDFKEMKVYVTIPANEPLKVGVRSGNGGRGVPGTSNMHGWVRMDNFRLFKLAATDAADVTLSNITLSTGSITDFSPEKTTYSVTLPLGTTAVTPTITPTLSDVKVSGAGEVDVTSGSGQSFVTVTALDGTTTQLYTINYTVGNPTGINEAQIAKATYFINNNTLTVSGADYTVYNVNGIKIANNAMGTSIDLAPGVYVVRTNTAQTFKVVIK